MRKGTKVSWKYGTGTADDPAFVIVQDSGDKVLKLQSEVTAAK